MAKHETELVGYANFCTGGPQTLDKTRHEACSCKWEIPHQPFDLQSQVAFCWLPLQTKATSLSALWTCSPPPHGVQHPHASAAWDRNPHPHAALQGHQQPCFCAKGERFTCVLRACSSLGSSSRRHPRKQQPRGLPASPMFWKEQPCDINQTCLALLPALIRFYHHPE